MKMHALVCVWVLRLKIGWRLLAVFRSNRGSLGLFYYVAEGVVLDWSCERQCFFKISFPAVVRIIISFKDTILAVG